jgi:hypothetical protein
MRLRRNFDWSAWCAELVRDVHTRALRGDPITRAACQKAYVLFVRDADTKAALPRRLKDKTIVQLGVGIEAPGTLAPTLD